MEHGKTGKQNNSPTKHVTLLVSMGLCASASMYICAIFLSPAAEEEEAEGDAACFCEEADGERCCAAAALLDAAADDEGVVELVATLRDETELIVTGRRLPGELCAPLRPLRTALIQGWWWWWGGGGEAARIRNRRGGRTDAMWGRIGGGGGGGERERERLERCEKKQGFALSLLEKKKVGRRFFSLAHIFIFSTSRRKEARAPASFGAEAHRGASRKKEKEKWSAPPSTRTARASPSPTGAGYECGRWVAGRSSSRSRSEEFGERASRRKRTKKKKTSTSTPFFSLSLSLSLTNNLFSLPPNQKKQKQKQTKQHRRDAFHLFASGLRRCR